MTEKNNSKSLQITKKKQQDHNIAKPENLKHTIKRQINSDFSVNLLQCIKICIIYWLLFPETHFTNMF